VPSGRRWDDAGVMSTGAAKRAGFHHGSGIEVWSSASWRALAVSWLDEQLAAAGIRRTGQVDQPHLRPWATALTAPTSHGRVWLKATGPATAFEVGLYQLLERVAPDHVLTPIAADTTRGWILLPDGGPPLGDRLTGGDLVDAMVAALLQYGQLQRDLAPHADALLALGVTDMRAAIMPTRFEEALEAVGRSVQRRGGAAEQATWQRVAAMRDRYAGWCWRLAAAPGSPSLDHNDLHPWNILVAEADGAGQARFYDWGDSVVAHPFVSMLVPLGFTRDHLGVGDDAPELLRLRDAYLEPFGDLAPHAELVAALELACRVGKVARTLTWNRTVGALGDEEASGFADAPLRELGSLLEDSYLGRA
jgi:hypothetical protein